MKETTEVVLERRKMSARSHAIFAPPDACHDGFKNFTADSYRAVLGFGSTLGFRFAGLAGLRFSGCTIFAGFLISDMFFLFFFLNIFVYKVLN